MKKALCIILTVCMLASLGMIAASASDATATPPKKPDWVITEVMPDNHGTAGYSGNEDPLEYIEIYNSSGSPLNLYDYCLTYQGSGRTSDSFETIIQEITPIKPGDYLDGSNLPWSGQTNECSDLSNKPVNPDTCVVQPGEVVLLWVMYHEAYYTIYNNGKGISIDDFREFHSVPANVKVIAVDGNSNANYGGNDKNFNVKNSATGTYGIALYSDALNSAANVEGSNYPVIYSDSIELSAWTSVDFDSQIPGHIANANLAYNYTFDMHGYGSDEWFYVRDGRRMVLCEFYADRTPGWLTPFQKLTLGEALDAGDSFNVDDIYAPNIDAGDFLGFEIGGKLYAPGSTFTAESAGVQTIEYKYGKAAETSKVETTKADTTKADTTKADVTGDETTVAPAGEETTTPVTNKADKKSSCKSAVTIGLAAVLLPAAVIVAKKKKD